LAANEDIWQNAAAIEREAAAPAPSHPRLRQAAKSLQHVLEHTAAAFLAEAIVRHQAEILDALDELLTVLEEE
jgi:hypothetical protein